MPSDRWSTAGLDKRGSSLEVALAPTLRLLAWIKPRGYRGCQLEEGCFIRGWAGVFFVGFCVWSFLCRLFVDIVAGVCDMFA